MSIVNYTYQVLSICSIFLSIILFASGLNTNEQLISCIYAVELKDSQTNNYLKYQNKQIGIEFEYPKDWYIEQVGMDGFLDMVILSSSDSTILSSVYDYHIGYEQFNKLNDTLDRRSEVLNLGIESLLGINLKNSTFYKFTLSNIPFLGEYKYLLPFEIDGHKAYKIVYPSVIQIPIETYPDIPEKIFNIVVFVDDNQKKTIATTTDEIDKIISSIKFFNPSIIDTSLEVEKDSVRLGERQNLTIHTIDKYTNQTLPYTNVTFKINYPSGFVLDIPYQLITDKSGKISYEWIIPKNSQIGDYTISVNPEKENYRNFTQSTYFNIYKVLTIEGINARNIDVDTIELTIYFNIVNHGDESIIVDYISHDVYTNNELPILVYRNSHIKPNELFINDIGVQRSDNLIIDKEEMITVGNTQMLDKNFESNDIWDKIRFGVIPLKINGTFYYSQYGDPKSIAEQKFEYEFRCC